MKLSELAAIKERMKNKVALRDGEKENRIVVGMGECGIAAGARAVLGAFVDAVYNEDLADTVSVVQMGCVGLCALEPIVEVYTADGNKATYVKMTPERALEVVEKHIKGGAVVAEYTKGGAN